MDEKEPKDAEPGRVPDRTLDLKELCSVWGPFEADVIKSFLEANGIRCLVRGRTVPFVYPFTVDGMAEFKIFVEPGDYDTAKELMAAMPPPDEEAGDPEKPR
jgi:hypothetical protein